MKKHNLIYTFFFIVAFLSSCNESKEGNYDPVALDQIDKLAETIGNLNSCSYTTISEITYGDVSKKGAEHKESDVYLRGPNKMYVYNKKPNDRKAYFYNGSEIAVFRFDQDTYEVVKAPDNIIATITAIHDKYGVDFPAADFFYPTLTDDLIHDFDTIAGIEPITIDGVDCHEINCVSKEKNVFIAIDKATNLPKRLQIFYLGEEQGKSYTITFVNFVSNPVLNDDLFEFTPPANAVKTDLLTEKIDD